jgi:Uma2 family endonuclease
MFMALTVVHHRFTVDEYEQMTDIGILNENHRVELIRGEIIEKMAIGDQHAARVNKLNRLVGRTLGDAALVSIQNPIRLPDSEPEPDVALLRPQEDYYASGKPGPADILLVIEVSDSTLDFDRDVKLPMYADAGISEYWIVNLVDETLEVYRQPMPGGTYGEVRVLRAGQDVEIAALPGSTFSVTDIVS